VFTSQVIVIIQNYKGVALLLLLLLLPQILLMTVDEGNTNATLKLRHNREKQ